MKTTTRVLAAAAVVALALSTTVPASASCGTLAQITTNDGGAWSHIMNQEFYQLILGSNANPDFLGNIAGTYGPYIYGYNVANPVPAPLSANAGISFWRAGSGDPAPGPGDDNGVYDMIATGGFYFGGYVPTSTFAGYLQAGRLAGTWQPAGIDGCVGGGNCMCVLITDQDGISGDWAILGGLSDANFNTFMDIGGSDGNLHRSPIILASVPLAVITSQNRDPVTFDVTLQVKVPTPPAGVFTQDGCACGPLGFKVLQTIVPRGSMPPTNRDVALWSEPLTAGGQPQPITPFGLGPADGVDILSSCGATNTDLYTTIQLVFEDGFTSPVVSRNGTRVECGPNLAEPQDRPRTIRPRGARPRSRRR